MKHVVYSFRHAETILKEEYSELYYNILKIIDEITDEEIVEEFLKTAKTAKSISKGLNNIFKKKFKESNWKNESKIFKNDEFKSKTWAVDFAKEVVSIEVGFNHGTVAAWNLIKPTIAGELNHVQKQLSTKIGVVITVTSDMKRKGGFDNAVGTFESYQLYIKALNNLLTIPILLIGLEAPDTFFIKHNKEENKKVSGEIVYNN